MKRYYENGKFDKFTTYISNHDWCLPVFCIISFIAVSIIKYFMDTYLG